MTAGVEEIMAIPRPERRRRHPLWAAVRWILDACALVWAGSGLLVGAQARQPPPKDADRAQQITERVERCARERGDAAVEACRAAVKLGVVETGQALPDSEPFYEAFGEALVLERRYQEALAAYREGTMRYRSNATLHFRLGRLLIDQYAAFEEALGPFSEAVRWNPQHKEALKGLADVHERLRRYPESIVNYRAALGIDPRYTPALTGLGQVLITSGDPQKAIEPLSHAVNLSPTDDVALTLLGWALSDAGRASEAIDTLRRALKVVEDPLTWCQLARALRRDGQEKEAQVACERALRPHNGASVIALCDCR